MRGCSFGRQRAGWMLCRRQRRRHSYATAQPVVRDAVEGMTVGEAQVDSDDGYESAFAAEAAGMPMVFAPHYAEGLREQSVKPPA